MTNTEKGRVVVGVVVLVMVASIVAVAGFVYLGRSPGKEPEHAESSVAAIGTAEPQEAEPDGPPVLGERDEPSPSIDARPAPTAAAEAGAPRTGSEPDTPDTSAEPRAVVPPATTPSYSTSPSRRVAADTARDDDLGARPVRPSSSVAPGSPGTASGRPAAPSASRSESETMTVYPGASGTASTDPAPASGPGAAPTAAERELAPTDPDPPAQPRSSSSYPSQPIQRPRRDETGPTSVPLVNMTVPASQVAVGDLVSVLITIHGASNVGHTPFHVLFNPAVLRFVSGDEGSFLASDGQPTAFFAATTSDGASVVIGLSRLGQVGGVSGDGDLCQLTFEVVGPGHAGLTFSRAKVRDSSNGIVQAIFHPANLTAG